MSEEEHLASNIVIVIVCLIGAVFASGLTQVSFTSTGVPFDND
jgi:hypothetical protein